MDLYRGRVFPLTTTDIHTVNSLNMKPEPHFRHYTRTTRKLIKLSFLCTKITCTRWIPIPCISLLSLIFPLHALKPYGMIQKPINIRHRQRNTSKHGNQHFSILSPLIPCSKIIISIFCRYHEGEWNPESWVIVAYRWYWARYTYASELTRES